MNVTALLPWLAPGVTLAAAAGMLRVERGGASWFMALAPILVLAPLAAVVMQPAALDPVRISLLCALVAAILARDRNDRLQSECALKLAWVLGPTLVLSWAGDALLALVTGCRVNAEQWAVLALPVVPHDLWSVALPLSLLAGLVLLGGAPFHFWLSDLFQGGRTWASPLAAAALQIAGAAWLSHRLEGVSALREASEITTGLLAFTCGTALWVGAAALLQQRRPERRVGTLASLQGALALAMLLAAQGSLDPTWLARWGAHLALTLAGGGLLARFVPVAPDARGRGSVLFRRHPATALASQIALLSLAGVPGTPGGALWLGAARALAASGHGLVLLALGAAWIAAFSAVMRQWRESAGTAGPEHPGNPVPIEARVSLWLTGLGTIALGVAWALA